MYHEVETLDRMPPVASDQFASQAARTTMTGPRRIPSGPHRCRLSRDGEPAALHPGPLEEDHRPRFGLWDVPVFDRDAPREVGVERFVGVDDARRSLGRLVEEVATSGDVVSLTKRGKALAVLVSREEYLELKHAATERARAELAQAPAQARSTVSEAGLDVGVIDEAIAAARQL